MRDALREKDIETRLGITAGEVRVEVDDNGSATVTLKRDHLDALVGEMPGMHDECGEYFLDDLHDARADGYRDGRSTVLKEIAALTAESAA